MKLSPLPLPRPTLAGLLCLSLLAAGALAGCDADEPESVELRAAPEGSEPSPAPEPCGDAAEIPEGAVAVASAEYGLVFSTGHEDPAARMSGASSWEYSCSCEEGSGACQVQVVGGKWVQCYSASCTDCKLNETKSSSLTALSHLAGRCDEPGSYDDDAANARADQIQSWAADMGYPEIIVVEDGHAANPVEGFGLVVEVVGGRMLTYQVPAEHFDADGELTSFVGPFNEGPGFIAQAAGGGAITCSCDGSGECSLQQNGLCKGLCEATGAQKGCVVKSKIKLEPIKL